MRVWADVVVRGPWCCAKVHSPTANSPSLLAVRCLLLMVLRSSCLLCIACRSRTAAATSVLQRPGMINHSVSTPFACNRTQSSVHGIPRSAHLRSSLQRSMTAMGMLPMPSKARFMRPSLSCRLLV